MERREAVRPPMWIVGILLVAVLLLVGALVVIFLSASGQIGLKHGGILLVLGMVFMPVSPALARKYRSAAKSEPKANEQK